MANNTCVGERVLVMLVEKFAAVAVVVVVTIFSDAIITIIVVVVINIIITIPVVVSVLGCYGNDILVQTFDRQTEVGRRGE